MYFSFCKKHNKKKSQEADRSMFSFGEEKRGDGVTSFSALAKHADLQNSWPRKEQSKVNYIAPAGSRTRDARVGNLHVENMHIFQDEDRTHNHAPKPRRV